MNSNSLEEIRELLYVAIIISKNIYRNPAVIVYVNEIPLLMEPITNITLEKNFGKSKQRMTCILCVFAKDEKAPSFIIFKGDPNANLEKKIKSALFCKN